MAKKESKAAPEPRQVKPWEKYNVDRILYFQPLDDQGRVMLVWPGLARPPLGWEGQWVEDVTTIEEFAEWLAYQLLALRCLDNLRLDNTNPGQSVRNAYRLIDRLDLRDSPPQPLATCKLDPNQEITCLRVVQDWLARYTPPVKAEPPDNSGAPDGALWFSIFDMLPPEPTLDQGRKGSGKEDAERKNKAEPNVEALPRDEVLEARGKWLYEQRQAGATLASIKNGLTRQDKAWPKLDSPQAVQKAIDAYAESNDLPILRRKRSRRRK